MRFLTPVLLAFAAPLSAAVPAVQDGDLIFQSSRSSQSAAIQQATRSRYCHMGLILMRDGKPYVFEAVGPVRYTPLARWIASGVDGHFVVKRLKDAKQRLGAEAVARLRRATRSYEGKRYDFTFEWSDEKIYCSELAWKMYRDALDLEISSLRKLRDFDLTPPAVRLKLRERYGSRIPLDETVVTPQDIFDSPLLETVLEG